MQLVNNRKSEAVKGVWVNDWLEGKFRELGAVRLVKDNIAPRIAISGWANGGVVSGKKINSIFSNRQLRRNKKIYCFIRWTVADV